MERIPSQNRTKIVELYFATISVVLAQRTFRTKFPGRHCPNTKTIKGLVDKFRNTGSVVDDNKDHSGRPFLARTTAKIQKVKDRFQQSPQ